MNHSNCDSEIISLDGKPIWRGGLIQLSLKFLDKEGRTEADIKSRIGKA